ncbi:MAG: hypothetical protein WCA81_18810 [Rhizomicrobium sp.]
MSLPTPDKMEESAAALKHEIEKLDELGLSFAASLVRIAHMDLQMRLCGMTENDIDVLSFASLIVTNEMAARAETQPESGTSDNATKKISKKQV